MVYGAIEGCQKATHTLPHPPVVWNVIVILDTILIQHFLPGLSHIGESSSDETHIIFHQPLHLIDIHLAGKAIVVAKS